MTKNFEKAKKREAKKEKNKNRKKWWVIRFKEYAVPLYFLPLALILIPYYEIEKVIDNSIKWSNETANKALDASLPKFLKWDDEAQNYYCYLRIHGSIPYSKMPLRYRKWAKKFSYHLKDYLLEEYQHELYNKEVEEDYDWYYITFTEKK